MEYDKGYLKINRAVWHTPIIKNPKWFQVYIYCYMKASTKKKDVDIVTGRGQSVVTLERGQFISGRNQDAERLGLKPSTFRNIMKRFQDWNIIGIKRDSHYSIVTVLDYDASQDHNTYEGQAKRQAKDNQATGKGQPKDTNNKVKELKEGKKVKETPEEALKLARELALVVYKNNKNHSGLNDKSKNKALIDQWAAQINMINGTDKQSWELIERVIAWLHKGGCWKWDSVIQSGSGLRKHFNQLCGKMSSNGNSSSQNGRKAHQTEKIRKVSKIDHQSRLDALAKHGREGRKGRG